MAPFVALILCTVFVILLLWHERRHPPQATRAIWIPALWLVYAGSKPLGAWFSGDINNIDAGSPPDRIFLTLLICISLIILIKRRFDWPKALKSNSWLIAFVAFELASVLWSDIPFISFRRWVKELGAVLIAFVVMSEPSPRASIENLIRKVTYILIPFSVLLVKYFPALGVQHNRWSGEAMWLGVTMQKNGLGRLCMISIFFLVWTLVRRWHGGPPGLWRYQTYLDLIVLAMAGWLMKGPGISGYSATGAISLLIGLLTYLSFLIMKKRAAGKWQKIFTPLVALIVFVGVSAPFNGGTTVSRFASPAGRDETLTGRTQIWASLLPVAMQRPILGRGFGGFWTTQARIVFDISEAHNGYLDVMLDLGFAGIIFLLGYLLWSCRKAQICLALDYDWGALWLCYIVMLVVHNISETSINSLVSHLSAVVLLLSVSSVSRDGETEIPSPST